MPAQPVIAAPVSEILRTTGSPPSRTNIRKFHVAYNVPYMHDFVTILCRQQAAVIQNQENASILKIG
jgi:hypothetical protein